MTAAKMMTLWAIGATIIFFLLVALATARRMHAVRARARLPKRYRHLRALEHSIGWPRAGVTLAATACALWLTWSMPDHAGLFLAPTLWAGLITLGLIGIDQLVLGRTPRLDQWRPPTNVRAYFSWKPIALVIVLAGVLIYTIRWASGVATKDGRRVFGAWTTDGEAHWGWSDPFPGAYYTDPLKWMLPLLVALILAGVVVTFARHTYRAGTRYAALDRGFRRRTISDLTLALIGALGGTLATISLDIAWACAILGSNSPDNAAVVGINAVVGLCATGLCFWVEASLIFLPVVSEDKTIARMWLDTPDPTALVNPSASNSGAIALVDAALSAGAREDEALEPVSPAAANPVSGGDSWSDSGRTEPRRVIALGPGPAVLSETRPTVETTATITEAPATDSPPSDSAADLGTATADLGTSTADPMTGADAKPSQRPTKKGRAEAGSSDRRPPEEAVKKTARATKAAQTKKTPQGRTGGSGAGAKSATKPANSSIRRLPPVKKAQPSSKHKPTAPAKQTSRTKQTTTTQDQSADKPIPSTKQPAQTQQRSAKRGAAAKNSSVLVSTSASKRGRQPSSTGTRSNRAQSKQR